MRIGHGFGGVNHLNIRATKRHNRSELPMPTTSTNATSSRTEPAVTNLMKLSTSHAQPAEAPRSRKLGKQHANELELTKSGSSSDREENTGHTTEENGAYLEKHHHHHGSKSTDKSIIGGGVILGGVVMAFVVSILFKIQPFFSENQLHNVTADSSNGCVIQPLFLIPYCIRPNPPIPCIQFLESIDC
ncbi:hypothetical protein OSB04_020564 [Centaurea solstitialis]|uniref:Uncharacterized protein n=1 Tax=Centaurea solstitialis TaxID=347529 RepID=A0AA38T3W2_9ASTR|nr:hypothetical protein OSB04_020564 [Centaurea solstitialis]